MVNIFMDGEPVGQLDKSGGLIFRLTLRWGLET
jgi:hypothetical protein